MEAPWLMIGLGADAIDLMLAGRLDVAQGWGKGGERLQWHRASKRCSGILDRARSQDSAVAGDRRVQRDARKKDVRARICCLACVVKRGKAQCPHRGALICARASAVDKPALQTCSGCKTPRRACSTATRFAVDPLCLALRVQRASPDPLTFTAERWGHASRPACAQMVSESVSEAGAAFSAALTQSDKLLATSHGPTQPDSVRSFG